MDTVKSVNNLQEHESGVRKLVSEAHNLNYKPLKNFEEAKEYNDAYMIMEGDDGGQIYLSIPIKFIKCNYETLKKLLKYLDNIAWPENQDDMAKIFFERLNEGDVIIGGMGGGLATNSLWLHDKFANIRNKIEKILIGEKDQESFI